jgi:hypothetical protein
MPAGFLLFPLLSHLGLHLLDSAFHIQGGSFALSHQSFLDIPSQTYITHLLDALNPIKLKNQD